MIYQRQIQAWLAIGIFAFGVRPGVAQEVVEAEPTAFATVEEWQQRRAEVVDGFERVMGKLPSREGLADLDLKIKESVQEEGYVRHLVDFVSADEDADRIPAYLYIPSGSSEGDKRAGIVALHPTHKIGKDVVDGLSQRPNRGYAKELAQLGYVVVAPDYPSFGEYLSYDFAADRYKSGTLKAVWNHMRCVDLLQSLPEVHPERIGAIGHSLGGHNAIFLGVMDERVQAVVSSCGWTPFRDYKGGDITGWTSDRYMPALRDEFELDPDRVPFDFPEMIAALAPRAFFSNSPLWDSNFDYRGVEKAAPVARNIYNLYGVPDKMRIAYPDAEHDFPQEVREESFRFLGKWLGMEEPEDE